MIPGKLQLKLYARPGTAPEGGAVIPVFHRFIREGKLPELLIDVADYSHVPRGPGVLLVGHATDYAFDQGEGRPGLLTSRKREPAPEGERLADVFRRALAAATLLEGDATLPGLVFTTDELLFRVNDRLAAPPTDATFAALRPALATFAERLFGTAVTLEREGSAVELFTVRLRAPGAPGVSALLGRI